MCSVSFSVWNGFDSYNFHPWLSKRQTALQRSFTKTKGAGNVIVCPRSSDPFYIVTYYIKWVTSSGTHNKVNPLKLNVFILATNMHSNIYYKIVVLNLFSSVSCNIFHRKRALFPARYLICFSKWVELLLWSLEALV